MKKTVLMILGLALCIALTVGSTVAYLTDQASDVNVMSLGNIDIELYEKQRTQDGELEDFVDFKELYPFPLDPSVTDSYGLPTADSFQDKIVYVKNTFDSSDAFVRAYIGVPAEVINVGGNADVNALHLHTGENVSLSGEGNADGWDWNYDGMSSQTATIDGIEYLLLCYDFNRRMAAGETSDVLLAGVYMDELVDWDDELGKYTYKHGDTVYSFECDFSNGLNIPVYVQAVQATGFENADQAFAAAGMDNVEWDAVFDLKFVNPDVGGEDVPGEEYSEEVKELLSAIENMEGDGPAAFMLRGSYDFSDPKVAEKLNGLVGGMLIIPDDAAVTIKMGKSHLEGKKKPLDDDMMGGEEEDIPGDYNDEMNHASEGYLLISNHGKLKIEP